MNKNLSILFLSCYGSFLKNVTGIYRRSPSPSFYLTGFANILFAILIALLLAYYHNTAAFYPLFYPGLFIRELYFGGGMKIFFRSRSVGGYIKVFAVLSFSGLIGTIILFVVLFFYVYHGAFDIMPHLAQPRVKLIRC